MRKDQLQAMTWYTQISIYGSVREPRLLITTTPVKWNYRLDPFEDQRLNLAPKEKPDVKRVRGHGSATRVVGYLALKPGAYRPDAEQFAQAETVAKQVLAALENAGPDGVRIGDLDIPEGMSLGMIKTREITHTWAEAIKEQQEYEQWEREAKAAQAERDQQFEEARTVIGNIAPGLGLSSARVTRVNSYSSPEVYLSAEEFLDMAQELMALRRAARVAESRARRGTGAQG